MNAQDTSLFIGRFQPFHNGHLDAVRQIFEHGETKHLLIGIGNAEESHMPENPFTAGERFEMIFESLVAAGFSCEQFSVCPIRNINCYALWPHHVARLLPPFARVFSGSPIIRRLFSECLPQIQALSLKNRIQISATEIRAEILKDKPPQEFLPPKSLALLKRIDADGRLKEISRTSFDS
jgi:nicotinamide-nucleotide adenylyltransferase